MDGISSRIPAWAQATLSAQMHLCALQHSCRIVWNSERIVSAIPPMMGMRTAQISHAPRRFQQAAAHLLGSSHIMSSLPTTATNVCTATRSTAHAIGAVRPHSSCRRAWWAPAHPRQTRGAIRTYADSSARALGARDHQIAVRSRSLCAQRPQGCAGRADASPVRVVRVGTDGPAAVAAPNAARQRPQAR